MITLVCNLYPVFSSPCPLNLFFIMILIFGFQGRCVRHPGQVVQRGGAQPRQHLRRYLQPRLPANHNRWCW